MITDFKLFENLDDFSQWKEGDTVYYIGTDNLFPFGAELTIHGISIDNDEHLIGKGVAIKSKEPERFSRSIRVDDTSIVYYSIYGLLKDEQRFTKDIRKIHQQRFDL